MIKGWMVYLLYFASKLVGLDLTVKDNTGYRVCNMFIVNTNWNGLRKEYELESIWMEI